MNQHTIRAPFFEIGPKSYLYGQDVYNTIIAGADATGSSSGIAKAADRAAMFDEMIAAVRRAWDERHTK